jgi:hypothetical protein
VAPLLTPVEKPKRPLKVMFSGPDQVLIWE